MGGQTRVSCLQRVMQVLGISCLSVSKGKRSLRRPKFIRNEALFPEVTSYLYMIGTFKFKISLHIAGCSHSVSRNARRSSTWLILIKWPVRQRFHDVHGSHMWSCHPVCGCSNRTFSPWCTVFSLSYKAIHFPPVKDWLILIYLTTLFQLPRLRRDEWWVPRWYINDEL
jgi:hypothetical protein